MSRYKDPMIIAVPCAEPDEPLVGGDKPLRTVPALATISAMIRDRPPWQAREPLEVWGQLYWDARNEMQEVFCQQRGFKYLPVNEQMARRGIETFLLYGVTIVCIPDPEEEPEATFSDAVDAAEEERRIADRLFRETERLRRLRGQAHSVTSRAAPEGCTASFRRQG